MSTKKRQFVLSIVLLILLVGVAGAEGPSSDDRGLSSYVFRHGIDLQPVISLNDRITDIFDDLGCTESRLVAAVVFPELMRYSQFRDTIESVTTQLMYSSGVEYFNCSIGYMQMRPQFCVDVELAVAGDEGLREKYADINFGGVEDTASSRFQRVLRMRDLRTQCLYLLAFIEICDSLYNLTGTDALYRLKILATAYNSGTTYSREQLEYISTLPAFPYGTGKADSRWLYSTIVTDFYTGNW